MKRDMIETASKAVIDRRYNLSAADLVQLLRKDDPSIELVTAFRYGYVMGGRAYKAGKYREQKHEQ